MACNSTTELGLAGRTGFIYMQAIRVYCRRFVTTLYAMMMLDVVMYNNAL